MYLFRNINVYLCFNIKFNYLKVYNFFKILVGDANKPKAWSKYAKDSSAYQSLHPKEEDESEIADEKNEKKSKKKKDHIESLVLERIKKVFNKHNSFKKDVEVFGPCLIGIAVTFVSNF